MFSLLQKALDIAILSNEPLNTLYNVPAPC